MKERRTIRGKPLLIASAGLAISVASCNRHPPGNLMSPPGNLMAPPSVEVCFTIEPEDAKITANGQALSNEGCVRLYDGQDLQLSAEAPGYEPYQTTYNPPAENSGRVDYPIELRKLPPK